MNNQSIVDIIIEGIEDTKGEGFGVKHLKAIELANAAPELLSKLELAQKYLCKALADNELQGTAIPLKNVVNSIQALLDEVNK